MICANCVTDIPPSLRFCPFCGQSVGIAITADSPSPAPVAQASAAAPAPKRKIPRWLKIVLGVVAFIVVAVTVALWATSDVIKPIERQLDALRAGNLQAAYEETATAFRDSVSFADFEAFVKRYPSLARNASHSFSSRSVEASGVGEVKGTLTDDRGGVLPVQYKLVKENGAWRILGIHLGPSGN